MFDLFKNYNRQNLRLLLIGSVLFSIYYVTDCALDSLIFGKEAFLDQLFDPTAHEVTIRVLSGFFLFMLFIISSVLLNKNRILQEDLITKSQEVIAANRELEAYNYALSHEMRTSLSTIMLSGDLLQATCGDCAEHAPQNLLSHLDSGCEKLSAQIDAMLEYSEANRIRLERKRTAIDDIAREIAKEISGNTKTGILDFHIDNQLESECDPVLMRMAIKNLIESSVRKKPGAHYGEIRIGMKKREDVPIYYIRSTMPEIDPAQSQSLRPDVISAEAKPAAREQIDISTARAIIERHGGQLWTRNSPENSATYYFTLPS